MAASPQSQLPAVDVEARLDALVRQERDELFGREPDCECTQNDADLLDARGCELHDPNSSYNVRLRALTAVERLEAYPPVVGEPTECPF